MSKEKQIEEMAEVICIARRRLVYSEEIAEALYNAGYRKQEWISVEERLPERDGKYLAYTTRGTVELARCYSYVNGTPQFDYWITHWMPLPEAPKMKGGAEE